VNHLDQLMEMVARPQDPTESDRAWGDVYRLLHVALPQDFMNLVSLYGPGCFDDFLWLLQPSSANKNLDIVLQAGNRRDALRTMWETGENRPSWLSIAPEDLLPWAITDNGDVCYWVTSTDPDPGRWMIVVNEARGPRWVGYSGSVTEFLIDVLGKTVRIDLFPDDFPLNHHVFRSQN